MKICPDCKRHVRLSDVRCPFCGGGVPTTTAMALSASLGLAAALTGCGPAVDAGDSTGSADGSGSVGTSVGTTAPGTTASTGAGTSGAPSGTGSEDSTAADATTFVGSTGGTESSSGAGFIDDTVGSGGVYGIECSVWTQDCADGEKCVPWANDGSNTWNATRCTPVADDPRGVGEACTVMGSEVSGIDDCDATSLCFDVDPDTLLGTCAALCQGKETEPTCAAVGQTCVIENEGNVTLCLDTCDPLGDACSDERSCVAVQPEQFACVRPDVAGVGEPCTQFTDCEAGASCLPLEDDDDVCTVPCLPAGDECQPGDVCQPWGDAGLCGPA